MEYLKMKNWDKWQTYRADRGQPPWIKIHRRLMRDPEWVSLSDAERGQLVGMWLLAADRDGDIPASASLIQKLSFMESEPNINKFIELGFICHNGVNVASERRQLDQPKAEKNREDKNREYTASVDADEVDFYLTKKKKKLSGKRLKTFNLFWEIFDYKKGKAEASDSWLEIPSLTGALVDKIIEAAKVESSNRKELIDQGKTPKMAQGWLSGKRWEDETVEGDDGLTRFLQRHQNAE